MKKFDQEKVRKIAIDKKCYQQIYVLDHEKREDVINILLEMRFKTDDTSILDCYKHLPLVVNTRDLFFFTVGAPSMAAWCDAIRCKHPER